MLEYCWEYHHIRSKDQWCKINQGLPVRTAWVDRRRFQPAKPQKDFFPYRLSRWEQRFSNYSKALKKLSEAVLLIQGKIKENKADVKNDEEVAEAIDDILKEGFIHRFEYTFELAWNLIKDYALYQGNADISGPRDAIRFAFSNKLIEDGNTWMEMIKSKIKTSHTYNEETANEIFLKVLNEYYSEFLKFEEVMEKKRSGNQHSLFNKE